MCGKMGVGKCFLSQRLLYQGPFVNTLPNGKIQLNESRITTFLQIKNTELAAFSHSLSSSEAVKQSLV